jgi:hypothetical protein
MLPRLERAVRRRQNAEGAPFSLPGGRSRIQKRKSKISRSPLNLLVPFQKTDQFISRKPRFPQQGDEGSFWHIAIVSGYDGPPS